MSGVILGGFPEVSWQHSALYQQPGVTHRLDWGRTARPVLASLVDTQGMALASSSSRSWLEPRGSYTATHLLFGQNSPAQGHPLQQPLEPWRGSLPKSYFLWGSNSV